MTNEKEVPAIVVGALIFNPEGKVLLIKSHKWRDKYVIPGGHVELGERLIDAVIREVKEETGLAIHSVEFLCSQESIFDEAFHKRKHFVFLDYVCRTNFYEVRLNSEGQAYIWATFEETENLPLGNQYTSNALQACRHHFGNSTSTTEHATNPTLDAVKRALAGCRHEEEKVDEGDREEAKKVLKEILKAKSKFNEVASMAESKREPNDEI